MISATVNTVMKQKENAVSMDFYAVCIYALAAMGDLQLRLCTACDFKRDIKQDFQAQASLHIVFVSLLCFSIMVVLCQSAFELQERRRPVEALFGPKRYQVWSAFLFIILIQLFSLLNAMIDNIWAFLVLGFYLVGITAWFVGVPTSIVKLLPGSILYGFLVSFCQDLCKEPLFLALSPPKSGSSISDMDQILSVVTTLTLLAIQWKARYLILDLVSFTRRGFNWTNGDKKKEDVNEDESDGDEPILRLPVTQPSSTV
jgi:hypothetical protein